MATTDWKTAGTVTSEDRSGAPSWVNPTNAATSDDSRADCGVGSGAFSDWLRFVNFDFSEIPAGATIDGIEVRREGGASGSNSIRDDVIILRDASGQVGDNKATATYWPQFSDGVETHGADDDDWGAGLDRDDIVASTFGFDVSVANDHGSAARTANVDCFDIRITYTEASTGQPMMLRGTGVRHLRRWQAGV